MLVRAGHACEICRVPGDNTPHGGLHVDHDAARGVRAVRGLLCSRCNSSLDRPWMQTWDATQRYLADTWIDRNPRTVDGPTHDEEVIERVAVAFSAIVEARATYRQKLKAYLANADRGEMTALANRMGRNRETLRRDALAAIDGEDEPDIAPANTGRPKYVIPDDDTQAEIERVAELCRAWRAGEAPLWEAVAAIRPRVPDAALCEMTGVSRATLNRKLGPRPKDGEAA